MPPVPRLASAWGRPLLLTSGACCAGLAIVKAGGVPIPPWLLLAAAAALGAAIGIGVAFQQSGVFARPLLGVATSRREVAITFDDGPDPASTPALLDALDARGHRATFFVIGERAGRHPGLVAEIARRGHQVENHSWSHSYATPFVPAARLAAQLDRASDTIAAATGRRPRWFRPPVGLLSPRVVEAARRAGLRLVGWTATARDGVARTSADEALRRLAGALEPGAVLVLHDAAIAGGRTPVASAVLPRLLALLEDRRLRSVTLSALVDGATAGEAPAAEAPAAEAPAGAPAAAAGSKP